MYLLKKENLHWEHAKLYFDMYWTLEHGESKRNTKINGPKKSKSWRISKMQGNNETRKKYK